MARRCSRSSSVWSLAAASAFFEGGALGESAGRHAGVHDGLKLRTAAWAVAPLDVQRVSSSFFDDPAAFPVSSVAFDCALLMRNVAHQWHASGTLTAASLPSAG